VTAGGALFRPGDELHSSAVDCRGARVVTVSAGGETLSAFAAEGLSLDRPVELRSPEVAAAGARLQRAAGDDEAGASLILEGLALELFGHVLQASRPSRAPRPPRWLADARERLRDDLRAPRSLEALARAAGVSAAHLAASFRDRYAESVGGFLRRARVEEAARRLADTDQPLAEIALACGFCDQSHLTRTFRRRTGLTPGAWRRAARER
jgi:AraC family transcriptional regulator